MTEAMRDTILTIYDEGISKNKAIQGICKMYDMTRDEVIDVLRESDRMIPYQRQPKPEPSKEGEEIRAAAAQITQQAAADELPVANYIYEVLAEKMDELEMHMRELEKKKQWYMARYQTIAMYLKETSL